MASDDIYIGLMSGTSVDAIDAVAINLSDQPIERDQRILGHHSLTIPENIKKRVIALSSEATDSLSENLELDFILGHLFADATLELLHQLKLKPRQVQAIGCHGQTIRHKPPQALTSTNNTEVVSSYSQQIADANIIAERTDIDVVADFRRRDIAAGGQAAPLVPTFHAHWFGEFEQRKVAVNIGGMANISVLESDTCVAGFDSGPGNALMDYWCQKNTGKAFDQSGEWASKGEVLEDLLAKLYAAPYFSQSLPKSTGRELFNADWLEAHLCEENAAVDIQATLLELTALSLSDAIALAAPVCSEIILCGGGVYNTQLVKRLQELCKTQVVSCQTYGLMPEQVEGAAFAWLAKKRLLDQPGNAPKVTGAKGYRILGALYSA